MTDLIIQVQREAEWRNVTTVRIEPKNDADTLKARERAFSEARAHLTGWLAYGGFFGLPLRIAEAGERGQMVEARP